MPGYAALATGGGRFSFIYAPSASRGHADERAADPLELKRFGLFPQIGEPFFFPTIGVAVSTYLESHKVDWVDWEDRPAVNRG